MSGHGVAQSAAQISDKTFPGGGMDGNGTASDTIGLVREAFHAGAAHGDPTGAAHNDVVDVGTPVTPELRQVTPAAEMGMGFREAAPGGVH